MALPGTGKQADYTGKIPGLNQPNDLHFSCHLKIITWQCAFLLHESNFLRFKTGV
jgi:hypothetical protein